MYDEPLGCLLGLLWLPYEAWKWMSGQSRVGTSEWDRDAGRFWAKFALIGSIVLLFAAVTWILWLQYKS